MQSLVAFRVIFGGVVAFSALRLLFNGWVEALYAGPAHHLAYPGLSWIPVLSAPWMKLQVIVIAMSAIGVMIGFLYRLSICVMWFTFTWLEFTEASVYLNHYWFVSLMAALMMVLPMDSRDSAPVGAVWLVRFQVAVVYCFAGVAKLHVDWLAHGLPMALWLPAKSDLPLVGSLLSSHATAIVLSVAGAIFDCSIVGFLLWRRTRLGAWLVVVGFHLATWVLFPVIGVFPFLMIGASTIFFDPDWPSQIRSRLPRRFAGRGLSRATPIGVSPAGESKVAIGGHPTLRIAVAAIWMALQLLLPLRQFAYRGDARFTGEGFRFSWNVLAVEKSGDVMFRVTDRTTGVTTLTDARDLYTEQQWRALVQDPELIRQAAHEVAANRAERLRVSTDEIEVRADAFVSFNGRAATRLVNPRVDLSGQPWRLGHQPWVFTSEAHSDAG